MGKPMNRTAELARLREHINRTAASLEVAERQLLADPGDLDVRREAASLRSKLANLRLIETNLVGRKQPELF